MLWAVVKLQSGIPVEGQVCQGERAALTRARGWCSEMNPDDDETGVFPVRVLDSGSCGQSDTD